MPDNRFYTLDALEKGTQVFLGGEEMRHMARVMRRKEGESVELVNGKGTLARGRIEQLGRDRATLHIEEATQAAEPKRQVILAQALLRPSLLDLVIEKGTELGATAFWLFPGEQSEKKELSDGQMRRAELLSISALKQSGRLYLPSIELKPPLLEWQRPSLPLLFGRLDGHPVKRPEAGAIIVIGPGKGLTEREKSYLTDSLGARGISLNSNTLRAETAALCALSLLV